MENMMSIKSKFNNDAKQEKILTPIIANLLGTKFQQYGGSIRIIDYDKDSDKQYAGIDFEYIRKQKVTNFDVKCQTNKYINNPTPTFCLEITSKNKHNKRVMGWLFKEDNRTDYYVFVWIHKATLNEVGLIESLSQIDLMDIMLVKKTDIFDYFDKIGLKRDFIFEKANTLVKDGGYSTRICSDKNPRGIKMTYSTSLQEAPVNIVIPKMTYASFPNSCFYIYDKKKGLYASDMPIY